MPSMQSGPAAPSLTTEAPRVDAAEAASLVRENFGIAGKPALLTSERDVNFRIDGDDGRRYVLKISNPMEDVSVTDFQTQALLHVARRDPALPVARVMPAIDGSPAARVALQAGPMATVRLLTYLEGIPQHMSKPGDAQRADVGRSLARLDAALSGFAHPASHYELLWDLKHAAKVRPMLDAVETAPRRAMATHFLDRFERHVLPAFENLRTQIIHNDFNPHNLLVAQRNTQMISGILDFGDMVHGPLACDLAVAASYQVEADAATGTPDVLAPALSTILAYHQILPLRSEEIDLLFDLIAMRHVQTIVITEWRAARHPENRSYILRNHPRAWRGLQQLASLGHAQCRAAARAACLSSPQP